MFTIEDYRHGEAGQEFATREEAIAELRRPAAMAWDEPPNRAPCSRWRNCGRSYVIVEYDQSRTPWRQLSAIPMLDVSSEGAIWRA